MEYIMVVSAVVMVIGLICGANVVWGAGEDTSVVMCFIAVGVSVILALLAPRYSEDAVKNREELKMYEREHCIGSKGLNAYCVPKKEDK